MLKRRRMAVKNKQERLRVGDTTTENNKVKYSKFTIQQDTKAYRGSRGLALLIL